MLTLEILNAKQYRLTEEDIKAIVNIEHHPMVYKWLYISVDSDVQTEFRDYKKFFRKLSKNEKADILIAQSDKHTIGFLGLWRLGDYMEHVATIGVSVHPDYWGKGVATQLVKSVITLAKEKGIRRLEIETLVENAPMRHVTERLGFKQENLRKDRIQKNGLFHDEISYSMLL